MANFSRFSITEPLSSGYDFYTADDAIAISASFSASLTLTAQATEILHAQSTASGASELSANATKIAHASVSIQNILSTSLTAVFERQDVSASISANLNISVDMEKIAFGQLDDALGSSEASLEVSMLKEAYAQSSISGHVDVADLQMTKTAKANSALSSSLSITAVSQKISHISSSMSAHVDLSILGKIVLLTIRTSLLNNLTVTPRIIKYRPSVGGVEILDTQQIRTLLSIDDKVITNHNRIIESSIEPIYIENTNVKNTRSRYYKSTTRASRNVFVLSWQYLPNSKEQTVDNRWARDYISSIAGDPDYHVLKITNMDSSGVTPDTQTSYNVLVTNYNETLVRRDIGSNTYYWDCSITLSEV
jgi:hypothetical protein